MKYILIISLLLTGLGSCEKKNITTGCDGPDRFIHKDAKAAFLDNGLVLMETEQNSDSTVSGKMRNWYYQPCSAVKLQTLKTQKANSAIQFNYRITCGEKYPEDGYTTYTIPIPRIVIYSVREL